MKTLRTLAALAVLFVAAHSPVRATPVPIPGWTTLTNSPGFSNGASVPILLQDGRVLMQNYMGNDWKILKPDINGSYINGTWSAAGNLPGTYGPLYYASGVLSDGRVVVCGGEYNAPTGGTAVETNLCAIYTPTPGGAGSWANLAGPGWANIGDGMGTVLPNGTFMLHHLFTRAYAILSPSTLTWTVFDGTTQGKADQNSEEGWTLMPENTLLCVECSNGSAAEKYVISSNTWVSAGTTATPLTSNGGLGIVPEIGPQILMNDGRVFVYGATGNTGIYTPGALPTDAGSWANGPTISIAGSTMVGFDSPGVIMPNGKALCIVHKGPNFSTPSHAVEFDGVNLAAVTDPAGAAAKVGYEYRMLVLPTGEIMSTDGTNTVQIYGSGATVGNAAWRPVISSVPSTLTAGSSVTLSGTQLTGRTEGSYYGDDCGNSTNYPIVRITNNATAHVFYCRAHDVTTRAIGGGVASSVTVDIPASGSIELGASTIEVIANGIPSLTTPVTVTAVPVVTLSTAVTAMQPTGGGLVNVGLSMTSSDPAATKTIAVYSNDNNLTGTSTSFFFNGAFYYPKPAAAQLFGSSLLLRADRYATPGRVYLIVAKATNGAGTGFASTTVVVPFSPFFGTPPSSITTPAAAAKAYCDANAGAPPPGALPPGGAGYDTHLAPTAIP